MRFGLFVPKWKKWYGPQICDRLPDIRRRIIGMPKGGKNHEKTEKTLFGGVQNGSKGSVIDSICNGTDWKGSKLAKTSLSEHKINPLFPLYLRDCVKPLEMSHQYPHSLRIEGGAIDSFVVLILPVLAFYPFVL